MTLDLPLIWAFIIAFAVFAYVVMDGFDLGIGILFPWFDVADERDMAMNSIAPVWDGNETWLVLGAGWTVRGLPYGIRNHFPGNISADGRDDAGSCLPRCRVRVPVARPRTSQVLGTPHSPGDLSSQR